MQTDPRNILLEGVIAAEAAITGSQRDVFRVWIDRDRDDAATRRLRHLCKQHHIRYSPANRPALDAAAQGSSHGGVLAETGPRRFVSLEALLRHTDNTDATQNAADADAQTEHATEPAAQPGHPDDNAPPFLAMLDSIEDPFNFGQAVRALFAAGCTGLIVRPRNWTTAAATIARASAGATERIPMAVAETPGDAADFFQAHGLMTVATGQAEHAVPYHAVDFTGPMLLLIGGERRGLRRSFLSQCESIVTVPYGQPFPAALGTVAASAVLAFEVARQRSAPDTP